MALYRLKNASDNEYPYVYTNPEPDTQVSHRDRVFVLGIEVPEDLQGDRYEMVEKDKEVELGGVFERSASKRKKINRKAGSFERGPSSRKHFMLGAKAN
jgi:hypothetical protein